VSKGGGWDKATILFLAKNSRLDGQGHCHGARNNPYSGPFLDVFIADSHTIVSTHSSKIADLLGEYGDLTVALTRGHSTNSHQLL
jgi:hypothetical protein